MLRRWLVFLAPFTSVADDGSAKSRYARAHRGRCDAPPAGDLRAWYASRAETAAAAGPREAFAAYACVLDACLDTERCRLSAAEGRGLRVAAARAAGGSGLAAPGLVAAPLLADAAAMATAIANATERRDARGRARVLLAQALASAGDLAGSAAAAAAALADAPGGSALAGAAGLSLGASLLAAGTDAGGGAAAVERACAALGANASGVPGSDLWTFVAKRLAWPAPAAPTGTKLAALRASATAGPPGEEDAGRLADALARRGLSDAAAAHAARAAPFGAGAAARARALLRGLPAVPRSRRALAVALDALVAGLDGDGGRGGPLHGAADPFADAGASGSESCSLSALGELLGGVPAALHHLQVVDDGDDLFDHPAVPREPPLLRRLANRALAACPAAPPAGAPRRVSSADSQTRVRVGVLASRLKRGPAARVAASAVAALARDPRLVTVACCFATAPVDAWTRAALGAFGEHAPLPDDAAGAASALVKADLDVLIFVDLPLDARALAFATRRFARIQVALAWSHFALSPSLPGLDYYLVPDALADAHAASRFGEQLVRLGSLGHPLLPDPPSLTAAARRRGPPAAARAAAGGLLAPGAKLFVVPVALRALAHPAFDAVLTAVLAADLSSEIVIVAPRGPGEAAGPDAFADPLGLAAPPAIAAALQRRICAAGGWGPGAEPCSRLRLLAPLPLDELRALVRRAAAVLDVFPVSDLDALLLAVQEHAPVVSKPAGQRRGFRYAERLLGAGAVLADTNAAYAAARLSAALGLANDATRRAAARRAMRDTADVLFGKGDTDLATFLLAAAGRPHVAKGGAVSRARGFATPRLAVAAALAALARGLWKWRAAPTKAHGGSRRRGRRR